MKRSDISDLSVCIAYNYTFHNGYNYNGIEALSLLYPNAPIKVLYSAILRANQKNYIDYGTCLTGGW